MTVEQSASLEQKFQGTVRLARENDLELLRPILETWIRNRDTHQVIVEEVEEVLSAVREGAQGKSNFTFLVAETPKGEVVGMMGFRPPEDKMKPYVATSNPAELIKTLMLPGIIEAEKGLAMPWLMRSDGLPKKKAIQNYFKQWSKIPV